MKREMKEGTSHHGRVFTCSTTTSTKPGRVFSQLSAIFFFVHHTGRSTYFFKPSHTRLLSYPKIMVVCLVILLSFFRTTVSSRSMSIRFVQKHHFWNFIFLYFTIQEYVTNKCFKRSLVVITECKASWNMHLPWHVQRIISSICRYLEKGQCLPTCLSTCQQLNCLLGRVPPRSPWFG